MESDLWASQIIDELFDDEIKTSAENARNRKEDDLEYANELIVDKDESSNQSLPEEMSVHGLLKEKEVSTSLENIKSEENSSVYQQAKFILSAIEEPLDRGEGNSGKNTYHDENYFFRPCYENIQSISYKEKLLMKDSGEMCVKPYDIITKNDSEELCDVKKSSGICLLKNNMCVATTDKNSLDDSFVFLPCSNDIQSSASNLHHEQASMGDSDMSFESYNIIEVPENDSEKHSEKLCDDKVIKSCSDTCLDKKKMTANKNECLEGSLVFPPFKLFKDKQMNAFNSYVKEFSVKDIGDSYLKTSDIAAILEISDKKYPEKLRRYKLIKTHNACLDKEQRIMSEKNHRGDEYIPNSYKICDDVLPMSTAKFSMLAFSVGDTCDLYLKTYDIRAVSECGEGKDPERLCNNKFIKMYNDARFDKERAAIHEKKDNVDGDIHNFHLYKLLDVTPEISTSKLSIDGFSMGDVGNLSFKTDDSAEVSENSDATENFTDKLAYNIALKNYVDALTMTSNDFKVSAGFKQPIKNILTKDTADRKLIKCRDIVKEKSTKIVHKINLIGDKICYVAKYYRNFFDVINICCFLPLISTLKGLFEIFIFAIFLLSSYLYSFMKNYISMFTDRLKSNTLVFLEKFNNMTLNFLEKFKYSFQSDGVPEAFKMYVQNQIHDAILSHESICVVCLSNIYNSMDESTHLCSIKESTPVRSSNNILSHRNFSMKFKRNSNLSLNERLAPTHGTLTEKDAICNTGSKTCQSLSEIPHSRFSKAIGQNENDFSKNIFSNAFNTCQQNNYGFQNKTSDVYSTSVHSFGEDENSSAENFSSFVKNRLQHTATTSNTKKTSQSKKSVHNSISGNHSALFDNSQNSVHSSTCNSMKVNCSNMSVEKRLRANGKELCGSFETRSLTINNNYKRLEFTEFCVQSLPNVNISNMSNDTDVISKDSSDVVPSFDLSRTKSPSKLGCTVRVSHTSPKEETQNIVECRVNKVRSNQIPTNSPKEKKKRRPMTPNMWSVLKKFRRRCNVIGLNGINYYKNYFEEY